MLRSWAVHVIAALLCGWRQCCKILLLLLPGAHAPQVLADIIRACWDQDPKKRPSFEEVLRLLKDAAKAC